MSHSGAENRAPFLTCSELSLEPLLYACRKLAARTVAGLARLLLVPTLLWGVPVVGILVLAAAITAGSRYPQAVVVVAFVAAFLTTCAYLFTARERQPDEAGLWAAAALWLALLAAAIFDVSDLVRGAREGTLVWLVGIGSFFAVWLPYLWGRVTVLPHATAWTLSALSALPCGLAHLLAFHGELEPFPGLLLAGAGASVVAGLAASVFAWVRLPASARPVVLATAVCLLGPVWLEASAGSSLGALGATVIGAVLMVVLVGVERVDWQAVLSGRGLALIPLFAAVAAWFALAPDALVLVTWLGGAIALGAWGILVVRRAGPDAAAQGAAVRAAATRIRSGAIAGAMLATVTLCGFLVTGLAWNQSSAQILVWLRGAGVPDINEIDIAGALLRDEYLWRDHPIVERRSAKRESPLDFWTVPEFDRWSGAGWRESRRRRDAEESVGTGLVVALDGGTTTVVLAPEGSPAHALGIRRGDRLLPRERDEPADEASQRGRDVFEIHFPMTVTVASPDGNERTVELTTRMLRDRRVFRTATIDAGGRPVGYIALRGFDPVAEREFVAAIASFRARGVRALVVDLRYNPGGRVYSAAGIAGAIVGERGRGQVFASTHHNSRYRDRDRVIQFRVPPGGGLGAEQLVVITSGASCSASELLVKSLEPYIPVAIVGTTTCGKPVGSAVLGSGDWFYSVMSFAVRNARGEGEYFDGLTPTCVAADDVAHELGDAAEGSLREALRYIETGRCSAEAVRAADHSGAVW